MNDNGKQAALPRGTVLHGTTTYTIEDVLGIGGFGITYLATKEETWVNGSTMRRRVAVKEHFFSEYSERAADGTTVRTADTGRIRETVDGSLGDFLAEAKRLQTLADVNANIVRVFDVFRANGTAYYVMEYLEGISLGAAIGGRPLAEADMLSVMKPIVDTVAFLHSQRINHLDIKPDNIVLTEGGKRPVLIDFGQSKHFRTDGSSTSTVNVKGATAGFAPAEQYDGIRTFSPTADVYALGATMMACLTGKTPPRALTWQNSAKRRDIDALPASPATKALIARALASDPAERYPDAGTMLAALGTYGNAGTPTVAFKAPDSGTTAPLIAADSAKPATRSYKWLIIAAVAALCIAAGAYFAFRGSSTAPAPLLAPEPVAVDVWNSHRAPRNLYLAVTRGGNHYYFSESDWNALSSSQRSECSKQGVVIDKDGQRFILALNNEPGEYTWDEAMSRFGNRLPTKEQGEAWISQQDAVQRAVRAFGGNMPGPNDTYYSNVYNQELYYWYWTRTETSSSSGAWYVRIGYGLNYYHKTCASRVRVVVPVSGSSAM